MIFAIFQAYAFLVASVKCSKRLHEKMVVAVLQAPVLFFNSNPVGRIMNRFSKDIGYLDEVLPNVHPNVFVCGDGISCSCRRKSLVLFVVVPMIVFAVCITRYYLKTSRQIKRLESISRSPVYSHFSETLDGLDTIRTRRRQRNFVDRFYRYVGLSGKTTKYNIFRDG